MTTQELIAKIQQQHKASKHQSFPSKRLAQQFIDRLIDSLFPVRQHDLMNELELRQLELMLWELLLPLKDEIPPIDEVLNAFFCQIPTIYLQLNEDAQAFLEFDPAAYSLEEVISAYPGFYAIAVHRFAHILYTLGVPIIPRLMSEYAHSETGIDMHPGATVGKRFFIDHGTGIVIGETCIIGDNVKIYQGVTLGALSVKKSESSKKRHPTIEDFVVIYSGATILGGDTTIGHHSVIGGNVWLTESLMPHSIVYHKSDIKVRNGKDYDEPINFVI